jgi:hypothetical protein
MAAKDCSRTTSATVLTVLTERLDLVWDIKVPLDSTSSSNGSATVCYDLDHIHTTHY